MERTFAIIKPDAVSAGHVGAIITKINENGFVIKGLKMIRMSRRQAEGFYAVHEDKPFFNSLVDFMTEGPVVVMVLEREDAIRRWRDVMGATNPEKAEPGTIRKQFGSSIERNATHGSDAPETAAQEIPFFFSTVELL